ncbi:MAG: amylo-alpha-1,6-glucosidase [Gaiella sp.]
MITVLEGSTFCTSDDDGQIRGGVAGMVADDTRFLSQLELTVDGRAPLPLGAGRVEYFNAAFYLRNAVTPTLPRDTISIARHRFIATGLSERLRVRNEGASRLAFDVTLAVGADFADIISLKAHVFARDAGEPAPDLPARQAPMIWPQGGYLIDDPESELVTWLAISRDDLECQDGIFRARLGLRPGEVWEVSLDVVPGRDGVERRGPGTERVFGRERRHVRRSIGAFGLSLPTVATADRAVEDVYLRSVADLASLRIRGLAGEGDLPAAGMPWFMTLFGRDTLITCLETMLFGPELATGALRTLAALQATGDHPDADAEPGKIPHEVRRGKAAATWFPIYYGSVDATPLFLVLLSELWRWTGDDALVHELRDNAMRALEWIDVSGDRDGDGLVEYERRTPRGLENQSWKDSGDSQRFRNGAVARPPIAAVEVQGYVFDAKRRAAELARCVWGDEALARRLEAESAALASRFDEAFWMERHGAYALALDADKQQVDALCSNMGHLLWSGIVPTGRQARVAELLLSPRLFSGWGVRTMASDEIAYNPISYHNGTVWPHDTAIAAWGLLERGFHREAHTLCRGLLDAAESLDGSLPEVFAGFDRAETPFVVRYPTSSQPQAWAAGAAILSLQIALGLRPDVAGDRLTTSCPSAPSWLGAMTLTGVAARGRRWEVTVENGEIGVRAP